MFFLPRSVDVVKTGVDPSEVKPTSRRGIKPPRVLRPATRRWGRRRFCGQGLCTCAGEREAGPRRFFRETSPSGADAGVVPSQETWAHLVSFLPRIFKRISWENRLDVEILLYGGSLTFQI